MLERSKSVIYVAFFTRVFYCTAQYSLVMSATGKDQYCVFLDEIDKPVFTVDTATPKSH